MEYNPSKLSKILQSPTLKLSGLSKAVGISSGYLTALKVAEKEPSARILGRIAGQLGLPMESFFDLYSHNSESCPTPQFKHLPMNVLGKDLEKEK